MTGAGRERLDRGADIRAERFRGTGRAEAGDDKHAVRMSPMQRRLVIVLAATAVLAVFLAGLFINGRIGGALLLLTDAVLVTLTRVTWPHVRPQGRRLRLVVIAAVGIGAIVKIAIG
jgi:hypothetical protein